MTKQQGKILVVDDDEIILLTAKMFLEQYFSEVNTLNIPKNIPDELDKQTYDVVLLDMNFRQGETSGKEGMKWLKEIISISPETSVLLMTAYGEVNLAVEAMKEGAADFIVKPWQNERLLATVQTALKLSDQQKQVRHLKSQQKILSSSADHQAGDIIGRSKAIKEAFTIINKVAKTDADVLILGENGTGKEVAARAIHRQSNRADQVFISVDLGSISETLFESELFGHKKGAFTDAKEDRTGRFEAASGGTLFLDEIGNLSLALQAKLLTVLQNRKIIKVGSNHPVEVDVRVICATNSNLYNMVSEGSFREDLLYRINTVECTIPPLRNRIEDIPLLTDHFLEIYCKKYNKSKLYLPEGVIKRLQKYSWPGNIRELQHAIERAVIMSDGNELQSRDFSFPGDSPKEEQVFDNYNLENLEAWAIKNAIKKHNGNISHAAKELGLSRGAMYRRMEKYGI
ncbi:sigma-54-dependent Fis family transcriptional regulator [Fulvivirga sp. 29W222]|uniref:Sigma-54-dependent Fis family transcriptional regulator n=1 Tax=Fulvivirga marina TaxID=2494733 RepID=A0A937KA91_9BACT|nr:sigma-54 dependent transcriptional regulator [Fulvivirga marina]MBL6444901.1 sigma-54-dependent Fis family transcriptional regulator [Fulvivirga marina]